MSDDVHRKQKALWDAEQRVIATRVDISERARPFSIPDLPAPWSKALSAALGPLTPAPPLAPAAAMDVLVRGGLDSKVDIAAPSLIQACSTLVQFTHDYFGQANTGSPKRAPPTESGGGYLAVAKKALGIIDGAAASASTPPVLEEEEGDLPVLSRVAGVDISFVKDTNLAVASVVVLSYPQLKVLHTEMQHVEMTVPYIPGYLAFREVPLVAPLIDKIRREHPQHTPQLLLVDGNGVHHPRGCGFATHLGQMVDIPSIGCAKNMLVVDGIGRDEVCAALHALTSTSPKTKVMPLVGTSGALWGFAALTGNSISKPIFISPGYRIGFGSALLLALAMSVSFRVPEPIRQADLQSREYIRRHEEAMRKEQAVPKK
jgi:deoxyinosine 3'endonuclease (endonuclease V)